MRPVEVRFGSTTPFFPLSFAYGLLWEPRLRTWFISVDHYLGYHMLAREEHRREVMSAANSYIAREAMRRVLRTEEDRAHDPLIAPGWEQERDDILLRADRLKIAQNVEIAALLRGTRARPIYDQSRGDDDYWCHVCGAGQNRHGRILERVRAELHDGGIRLED